MGIFEAVAEKARLFLLFSAYGSFMPPMNLKNPSSLCVTAWGLVIERGNSGVSVVSLGKELSFGYFVTIPGTVCDHNFFNVCVTMVFYNKIHD